ncbi:MAG: hypothetical protein ABJO09_09580 [Hyphomicrobiales bacterium]
MRHFQIFAVLAFAFFAAPAFAESCFINRNNTKTVTISMDGLVASQSSQQLAPGQRKCFDHPAQYNLSTEFPGVVDYWLAKQRDLTKQPANWREHHFERMLGVGSIVRLNNNPNKLVYAGPSVPFYVHRADVSSNGGLRQFVEIEIDLVNTNVRIINRGAANVGNTNNGANTCPAQTISRSQSDHSWVRFNLPVGQANQTIQIPGGAYNKYMFPKCNRVHWNNHTYQCRAGSWVHTGGQAGADALCHGGPPNSPYVQVGDR